MAIVSVIWKEKKMEHPNDLENGTLIVDFTGYDRKFRQFMMILSVRTRFKKLNRWKRCTICKRFIVILLENWKWCNIERRIYNDIFNINFFWFPILSYTLDTMICFAWANFILTASLSPPILHSVFSLSSPLYQFCSLMLLFNVLSLTIVQGRLRWIIWTEYKVNQSSFTSVFVFCFSFWEKGNAPQFCFYE